MVVRAADFDGCSANAFDNTTYVFMDAVQIISKYWCTLALDVENDVNDVFNV